MRRRDGVGVIFLASVLFGVMAVCVRVAAREMDALQVAFVRFTGSLLVLLVTSRGRDLRPSPGVGRRLALRALLGASAIVFYYVGIRDIGAGPATLLHCTYPVFATLFAALFMREPFTVRLGTALALNLGGAALAIGWGAALGPRALAGVLASATAAVLAGGAIATRVRCGRPRARPASRSRSWRWARC